MPKPSSKTPRFTSLRQERQFWQTHDAFDVVNEEDWDVVEGGEVQVESIYVSRVGQRGAILRVPKRALYRLGAKPGSLSKPASSLESSSSSPEERTEELFT